MTTLNFNDWQALLAAVANLAAIVGIASGFVAWIAMQDGEDTAGVADAAGLGVALGFVPGLIVAGCVYVSVAISGLSAR